MDLYKPEARVKLVGVRNSLSAPAPRRMAPSPANRCYSNYTKIPLIYLLKKVCERNIKVCIMLNIWIGRVGERSQCYLPVWPPAFIESGIGITRI
jgi:hypothetical protein